MIKSVLFVVMLVVFGCNMNNGHNNLILKKDNPFQTLIDSVVVSN